MADELRVEIDGQDKKALIVTEAALAVSIGTPADAAWDGVAAEATVISLLKKIALNTELNTEPA